MVYLFNYLSFGGSQMTKQYYTHIALNINPTIEENCETRNDGGLGKVVCEIMEVKIFSNNKNLAS
jgi:hypothetical protein